MIASEVRDRFVEHIKYDDVAFFFECDFLSKPDVAVIGRDLTIWEYEIKVSWSDLDQELRQIEGLLGVLTKPSTCSSNKAMKHQLYLQTNKFFTRERWKSYRICPNYFYFLIPENLYDKAKERLSILPYGVRLAEDFRVVKRAKALHAERHISQKQLWLALKNLSFRYTKAVETTGPLSETSGDWVDALTIDAETPGPPLGETL